MDSLGEEFSEGVILDLEGTWQESDIRTPLICFLSMGSDPTNMVEQLAKKHKIECRSISMGQGQEVHARRLMSQSMTNVSRDEEESDMYLWDRVRRCTLGVSCHSP